KRSAAKSVAVSWASGMASIERQNPAAVQRAIRRLPWRTMSAPENGMAVTEPMAVPNRASPRAPSPRCSADFTLAMRDTQVATTRPCTRKHAMTPQKARRCSVSWLERSNATRSSLGWSKVWLMVCTPGRTRWRYSDRGGLARGLRIHGREGDGVGAHLLPLVQGEAVGGKEGADARAVPAQDIFQDGDQHRERVVGEDAAARHLADIAILGDGDGETADVVDVQHDVEVARAIAHVDDAVLADGEIGAQLLDHGDLAVAGGEADDGSDLAGDGVVAEACAEDVIGRDHALQRGLHDFFRGSGDHVAGKLVAVDIVEQFDEARDVGFQADALARFDEMLLANLAVLGVVQQKVGQFPALLHQVDIGKTSDARAEIGNANQLGQYVTGIVKAERLVKIADQEIAFRGCVEVRHIESPFSVRERLDRGRI